MPPSGWACLQLLGMPPAVLSSARTNRTRSPPPPAPPPFPPSPISTPLGSLRAFPNHAARDRVGLCPCDGLRRPCAKGGGGRIPDRGTVGGAVRAHGDDHKLAAAQGWRHVGKAAACDGGDARGAPQAARGDLRAAPCGLAPKVPAQQGMPARLVCGARFERASGARCLFWLACAVRQRALAIRALSLPWAPHPAPVLVI
jgi:hypothetical protein